MNFSAWTVHKPTPSILLFIMLTVAGLLAFQTLGIQSTPDMEFPSANITARLPGASPVQLEAEVARPIEDSIASIGGIRHVMTTISDGAVAINVEFNYERNLQDAASDLRDAITRIRATLPAEMQEPVITRFDVAGLPVLTYAVTASAMDETDLSWFVDDVISKNLLQQPGVGQVRRQGGVAREVRIDLDPVRLLSLRVSADEISSQLRQVQQEAPGGRGNLGNLEQTVRTLGTVSSAEELANLVLPLRDGRHVRIADIATVRDTVAERRQLALLDGKPIIGFEVVRARGHDEVDTAQTIRAAVEVLRQTHPDIKIEEIWNTVDYAKSEYDAAMRMLFEGSILAVIVVWLFLRDWRATLVSAVALPLSIIPTFVVMAMIGYTLNLLTLLALTLVIGILVDDAIVEVENITRHLRLGKSPKQAAIEAADEIGLAVVATSLTLVAVFLPTAFVGGLTGSLFQQFGWTASAAVLFSLLVARLLTPMMSAYFLKPKSHHEADGAVMRWYLATVRRCLAHRGLTLLTTSVIFAASMWMITQIPSGFMGAPDKSTEVVILEAPPGSTLEQAAELTEHARQLLAKHADVKAVYATIGTGVMIGNILADMAAPEVRIAQITVLFKPLAQRTHSDREIQTYMRDEMAHIAGARISVGRDTPGEKMNLLLVGDDAQALYRAARDAQTQLRTLPNIGAVNSSSSLLRPEIVIRPDFARAAERGVTSAAIGQAVRVATTGDYDFNLPRLSLPGRQLYMRVQLDPAARRDPDLVSQLRVSGENGAAVALGNIAQISVVDGPAQIDRYDRHRYVRLSVDLQGRPISEVLNAAMALPALKNLPPSVKLLQSGDLEHMNNMFGAFLLAMCAGIFCVYAVMVLLFGDFGQPVTVLAALPLASTGALGLLWVFGFTLSMPALIGLLMLIGIVTKNSILLVDYAIMARKVFGMSRVDAVVDACHKRARPIVMTTVAMGAGMLPIALGLDGDSSFRRPMAVVVIGGLITSTVLSLLVVPVVFEIVDDSKRMMKLLLQRKSALSPTSPIAR